MKVACHKCKGSGKTDLTMPHSAVLSMICARPKNPPCVSEIAEHVKITTTTVYNSLRILVNLGLIKRAGRDNSTGRFVYVWKKA